ERWFRLVRNQASSRGTRGGFVGAAACRRRSLVELAGHSGKTDVLQRLGAIRRERCSFVSRWSDCADEGLFSWDQQHDGLAAHHRQPGGDSAQWYPRCDLPILVGGW